MALLRTQPRAGDLWVTTGLWGHHLPRAQIVPRPPQRPLLASLVPPPARLLHLLALYLAQPLTVLQGEWKDPGTR